MPRPRHAERLFSSRAPFQNRQTGVHRAAGIARLPSRRRVGAAGGEITQRRPLRKRPRLLVAAHARGHALREVRRAVDRDHRAQQAVAKTHGDVERFVVVVVVVFRSRGARGQELKAQMRARLLLGPEVASRPAAEQRGFAIV